MHRSIRPSSSILLLALFALLATTLSAQPLRLTAPNGGERIRVGSSVTIRWSGAAPTDPVTIEYSTNNGATWNLITNNGLGLQHIWSPVPNTPSDICLMRVSKQATTTDSVLYLESETDFLPEPIHFAEFSPDGTRVIGGGAEGVVYIWNSITGQLLDTIKVEDRANIPNPPGITLISCVRYSPDGSQFATVSPLPGRTGSMVRIFNAATGAKIREWSRDEGRNFPSSSFCAYSPDGTRLLLGGTGGGVVYNVADGSVAAPLAGYTAPFVIGSMIDGDWSRDGTEIVGAVLGGSPIPNFIISNPLNGSALRGFSYPSIGNIQSVRFNGDGTRFLSTSLDGSTRVHDAQSGTVLHDIRDYDLYPNAGVYSNSGTHFATGGQDNGSPNWKLLLYDAASGTFVREVGAIINGIQNIDFNPDDTRILVSCVDGVRIFQAPGVVPGASDISDSLWSIFISSGEIVEVWAPVVTARQGEIVSVPIMIDDPGAALGTGATRIDLTLRYNVSLLEPVGTTPKGTVNGTERVIGLSFPLTSSTDTILGTLTFRAALGDDSTTALDLENVVADVAAVTIIERDGLFRLSDLCREGGPRLLNPNGVVALKLVAGRPPSAEMTAELETLEEGRTSLLLVDIMGRTVKRLFDGEAPMGRWRIGLDLDDVPEGRYFVTLVTRTVRKSCAMEVVR